MHLHRLPNEVIHNIAFLVVAHDPLGPPAALVPLLTLSRRIHAALSSHHSALKARIFRLKFDTSAVSRRLFFPYDLHLAQQLEYNCQLLRVVKSKDVNHEDVASFLLSAYLMMLDNDGKNFAQLEWAGIAAFADKFVRLRLWDDRMQDGNAGWPVASLANRCALWVAWLTMDRVNLFKEPAQARNDFVTLIFPFTLLSPRYPSTEAPPNHFHLPLLPDSPTYQRPLVSSSNPALPPYPHYAPHPVDLQHYFGSIQTISPPLISIAAKLLFTARKEIFPINIPQTLPPGLRPEDYAEFNKGKAAEVPRGARWDWTRGCAIAVNSKRVRNAFNPATIEEFEEFEQLVRNEVEVITDGDEESRRWDQDWWRRILCADLKSLRPKFPPGLVYKPGTLRGTWQGRLYMPLAEALQKAIETYPYYPGYPIDVETPGNAFPTFSEASTDLVMLPVFFNVEEHHSICHCPSYHLRDTDDTLDDHKGCGTIPVPLPSLYPPRYMRWRGMRPHMVVLPPEEDEGQVEAGQPADNDILDVAQPSTSEPAPEAETQGNLMFGIPSDEVGAVEENPVDPGSNNLLTEDVAAEIPNTNALAVAANTAGPVVPLQSTTGTAVGTHTGSHGQPNPTPIPPIEQVPPVQPQPGNSTQPDLLTFIESQRRTNPRIPRLVPTPIDCSMNNAYFPGDFVPSLMSVKRRAAGAGRLTLGGKKGRDEIVFGFRELGMDSQASQLDWKTFDGRCATDKKGKGVGPASEGGIKEGSGQRKRQLYVYETYDPEKESMHDASVCHTCKEWEDARRKEKRAQDQACEKKLERRVEREEERRRKEKEVQDETATRMLEEYMDDYGKRSGISADVSRSSSTNFEPLDSKFGKDLSDALSAAAEKSAAIGLTREGVSAPVSGPASEPSDSDHESVSSFLEDDLSSCYSACSSEDEEEEADNDDDDDSNPQPGRPQRRSRRLSVLGDDVPHGQPACFDPYSQKLLPSTRRVFDRARVGAPEGCSGGVRDVVITGETPRRHVAWHRQMYRLYGRVRSWDGMIGLLRVDERSLPGYTSGLQNLGEHLDEAEYWSVITNMFICGYIVGGKTFVGEWRMAASDPLKPGWSGPVLMSLREQEDGEEPVWEPVGGEAI